MHICAQIHIAMTELTGNYHKTSNQHAELGTNRIKRDNEDLEKIKLWLEAHDPFDENEPFLKNIATGLTATEEDKINCDVAENVGREIRGGARIFFHWGETISDFPKRTKRDSTCERRRIIY